MTIKECIKKNGIQTEVDEIKRCSAIDIDFINKDGNEDETQINISAHALTKEGTDEIVEAFCCIAKELGAKLHSITSITVVASADTMEELEEMGY